MHTFILASRIASIFVLTFGVGTGLALFPDLTRSFVGTLSAAAREEEDEEEDEHEDEEREDDRPRTTVSAPAVTTNEPAAETIKTEKIAKPKTIIQEVVENIPVTETYIEIDPGYDTDSDDDGLVDALDPDPSVSQTAYFTDDDGDSVPNALDTRPGSDDILMLDELSDSNGNGILDSYESV